ncbi:MAG: hypothetical protein ACYCW6_23185 [Candidatus Xenobia bacterium]
MDRLPPPEAHRSVLAAMLSTPPAMVRPAFPDVGRQGISLDIHEGLNDNLLEQTPFGACHAVITTREKPRILLTFPAGNSGIGLWFEGPANQDVQLQAAGPLRIDVDGTTHLAVTAPGGQVTLTRIILDSIREIRDIGYGGKGNADLLRDWATPLIHADADWAHPQFTLSGHILTVIRQELDGREWRLQVALPENAVVTGNPQTAPGGVLVQPVHIAMSDGQPLIMQLTAHIPFAPLTPLSLQSMIRPSAMRVMRALVARGGPDAQRMVLSLEDLQVLTYQEKLLAGSWRFETYFGRDTLLTLLMLNDVISPEVVTDGLRAVLSRLSPEGVVAHEEDVGDWAEVDHLDWAKKGHPTPLADWEKPLYDYKMVDADFFLPILLSRTDGAERLLADPAMRAQVVRNIDRVLAQAGKPLVTLNPGQSVGDWRDSAEAGLAGGTVPGSINVDLVADSLAAIKTLLARPEFAGVQRNVDPLIARWAQTRQAFEVRLSQDQVRQRVNAYMNWLPAPQQDAFKRQTLSPGLTVGAFLAGASCPDLVSGLRFWALSMDKPGGHPIEVANSDGGFRLLLGDPPAEDVADVVKLTRLPFPIGLMTPVGMVVANPAYASDTRLWPIMNRDAYHGTVIWGWQHNLLELGLLRQIRRFEHDPAQAALVASMRDLLNQLARTEHNVGTMALSELWSWDVRDGQIVAEAFGERSTSADEANAVQLWSAAWPAVAVAREITFQKQANLLH